MKTSNNAGLSRRQPNCLTFLLILAASITQAGFAQDTDPPAEPWEQTLMKVELFSTELSPTSDAVAISNVIEEYQNILDREPQRNVELHVRLRIGAHLMFLVAERNPESRGYSDKTVAWYEAIVSDFGDWEDHYDLMAAKIKLGDLYRVVFGETKIKEAEELYWSVLEVPEEEIVFDDPLYTKLNLQKIAEAQSPHWPGSSFGIGEPRHLPSPEEVNTAYRKTLSGRREEKIAMLRRAACRALAYARREPGQLDLTISRLHELVKTRPTDELFQQTIYDYIAYCKRESQAFGEHPE